MTQNFTSMTRQKLLIVLVLLGATVGVYWPLMSYEFVNWDDLDLVIQNPYLARTWPNLQRIWSGPYMGLYTPVAYTFWWAIGDFASHRAVEGPMGTLNASMFHAGNVALHAVNVLLVFAVVNSLVNRPWAACAGALLFAMHPVQVEPVAWVSGMNNLICGAFSLLALWMYIESVKPRPMVAVFSPSASEEPKTATNGRGFTRGALYVGATCAFVLALFAKPVALVVPIVAFIIDIGFLRHSWRSAAQSLALWAIFAAPFVIITRLVQPAASIEPAPALLRPLVALDSVAFYLSKLLWPGRLAADYGRTPQVIMDRGYILWTWLAPVALAFVTWWWRKRVPWLWPAALMFVCAMLPVLGLTVFEFQNYSTVADRYMYLAMLGPAIAIAFVLVQWPHHATVAVVGIAIAFAAVQTSLQLRIWRDTETLFAHVMRINPTSLAANKAMAFTLAYAGKPQEALPYFQAGLRTSPRDADLNFNLGNLLMDRQKLDRPADSLIYFDRATEAWPTNPKIRNNYGIALYRCGHKSEALRQFQRALELDSHYPDPHANLGIFYTETGDLKAAEAHYRDALRLNPNFEKALQGLQHVEELRSKS